MPDIEPLYEDESTGMLQIGEDGKAFRKPFSTPEYGPSLSGPQPSFGRSMVEEAVQAPHKGIAGSYELQAPEPKYEGMTPEQMLALAQQMENDYKEQIRQNEGVTAVDPALIRTGGAYDAYTPEKPYGEDVPEWLSQYMDAPNSMSEISSSGLDRTKKQKHIEERRALAELKAKR